MTRRLKHWGWGYEDEQPSYEEVRSAAAAVSAHLGWGSSEPERPVPLDEVELKQPRLKPPSRLQDICKDDRYERVSHAYGKSYRDVVRAFRGEFDSPPDVVAHPRNEQEIEAVLEWCEQVDAAAIPFGGGTSVVGGVESRAGDRYEGVVSIDLKGLDKVIEVDPVSRAARIQAGAIGPEIEDELGKHDLTLRHFPQSFQFSTLGGWIATRSAGHFATVLTHIDEMVESIRAITPTGIWESRRLPGSGAGPSPDRMLIGSEGTLGLITEAWVRIHARPTHRCSATVLFPSFERGADAVRELSQASLYPANCRLVDAAEAALTGAGDGKHDLLLLGFESAAYPVNAQMEQALECCADHGGTWDADGGGARDADTDGARAHPGPSAGGDGTDRSSKAAGQSATEAAEAWRATFFQAPYLRDTLVAMGVLVETFETATTWDRFTEFHGAAMEETRKALGEVCGGGSVTCRMTHVYPDGPALYFTLLAPARSGEELAQWGEIKQRASDTVIKYGGTITHHHAIGRDHRRWYDQQRPDAFASALRGAKAAVDPQGILNPGVLIDPKG